MEGPKSASGLKVKQLFKLASSDKYVSKKLIKIATVNTKPKAGSIKSMGIKADRKATGNTIFQSEAKVVNSTKRKHEMEIKKDKISNPKKVLIDKEKKKSQEAKRGVTRQTKRVKIIKNTGAKASFLTMFMLYFILS